MVPPPSVCSTAVGPSEIESVEAMIRKLLPTPATPTCTLQAAPKKNRNALKRTMWKHRHSIGPQREQSRRGTPLRGVFHAERGHIIRRNVRL